MIKIFNYDEHYKFCRFFLQTEKIFEVLKAHLKRAPSLKGAALVKLSQLKVQVNIWPKLFNLTEISDVLEQVCIIIMERVSIILKEFHFIFYFPSQVDIKSDNWFKNILNIYKTLKLVPSNIEVMTQGVQIA